MEKKVMIVDDAAFMRLMLKNILEDISLNVVAQASTGKKAIQLYLQHKPDLVLMDITMPGMDGVETTKKLKQIDREAKVIICSAIGQPAVIVQAIEAGASDFIVKPFTKGRVLQAIQKSLSDKKIP